MILCQNKKIAFEYHIHDTYEAGIALHGDEVKSIRGKRCSLDSNYVIIKGNIIKLLNCVVNHSHTIPIDKRSDPHRPKQLLLHKSQIRRLQNKIKSKGFTIVATKLYTSIRNIIKAEICLVEGKTLRDKRTTIKQRDLSREARKYKD